MSRVVVLKLESHAFLAAVVRDATPLVVEAIARGPLSDAASADDQGRAIAAALGDHGSHRAAAIVAIPRSESYWQNFDLPPSPADDLPDLVHLQAQRDLAVPDDGAGFDFVSLEGDDEHPHRVVGVGVLPEQLDRIRKVCEAAGLKLAHVTPEPLGWPELGRRLAVDGAGGLTVFAAITGRQAVVWATEHDALRLVRTIWLPDRANIDEQMAVLAGELRRTLLALSHARTGQPPIACVYCGENAPESSSRLSNLLSQPVHAVRLDSAIDVSRVKDSGSLAELAPLAALAAAAAARRPPLADLLHPRRRPAPPSRKRPYVLAGVAAAVLALAGAWQAYRGVTGPKARAASADAQRLSLTTQLEELAKDEEHAAAIQAWQDESLNLLTQLDDLGQRLRPKPLDAADFKADEDVVLTKLTVTQRQIAIDASARATSALPPVEQRLRAGRYTADRGAIDPASKAVPGYGVGVTAVLQPGGAAAPAPSGGAVQ